MGIDGFIGIYGAALATVLALTQYRQWKASQTRIAIKVYDEIIGPPSHVEITITNLSNATAHVHFAGIGLCFRPWLRPWKVVPAELAGLYACEDGFLTKKGVEDSIESGKSMVAYADAETFGGIEITPRWKKGFCWKWMIQVEHSLPPYITERVFGWTIMASTALALNVAETERWIARADHKAALEVLSRVPKIPPLPGDEILEA